MLGNCIAERLVKGTAGHILWTVSGALLAGMFALVFLPGFFWALLLGGAMTAGALRVGLILMTSENGNGDS